MALRRISTQENSSTRLLPTDELWKAAAQLNRDIPKHWELVRIGDVAEILNGFAFKSSKFNEKHGTPLIRIRDLERSSTETLYDGSYDDRYLVDRGALLIGMDGDFRCAEWRGPRALLNQRVCKVEVKSEFLNPRLVLYGINRHLGAIQSATSSLTVTHISSRTIADIPFPLPPRTEQDRIVSRLERLFQQIRSGRESIQQVAFILRRFRLSTLAKAFSGELALRDPSDEPAEKLLGRIRQEREGKWEKSLGAKGKNSKKHKASKPVDQREFAVLPKSWAWASIGDIFDVGSGGTPRRNISEYWNGEVPWVSSGEVAFCEIRATMEHITQAGLENSSAKIYPPGTVLLALYGEGRTRGQAAILRVPAVTNQAVAAILCSDSPIPSEYVYWWLYYRYNETRRLGSGANQPNLYLHDVRSLPIPIAPIKEQFRLAEEVTHLLAQADQIEAAAKVGLKGADALDQSILAKAFRGELVPQDPNDEPASVLLERIRTQRTTIGRRTKSQAILATSARRST